LQRLGRGLVAPVHARQALTKAFVAQAGAIFARTEQLAAGDEALTRRIERAELPLLYVKCVRGPEFVGADYAQVVDRFERIARREEIRFLQEGASDFEPKLARYESRTRTGNRAIN